MVREAVNEETHRGATWRSWETVQLQISVSLMRQKTEAITLRTRITQGLGNKNITIKTCCATPALKPHLERSNCNGYYLWTPKKYVTECLHWSTTSSSLMFCI